MDKSLISIIIPTYQHAKPLPECLDSILGQTYQNIEVIVVDDGSIDNTQEVLDVYRTRVTVVRQENQGSNPARNRGWQMARGEYLLFCDADVVMQMDMLEKLEQALSSHPDVSFAYCPFRFGWKVFHGAAFDHERLKQANYIHTSALVRAKDFPGFDQEIKRLQDWDVWLTMAQQGKKGILVDEILFSVQISGESRIGSSWLPSIMYRFPWRKIGWMPRRIKKYEEAKEIILKKHGLCKK